MRLKQPSRRGSRSRRSWSIRCWSCARGCARRARPWTLRSAGRCFGAVAAPAPGDAPAPAVTLHRRPPPPGRGGLGSICFRATGAAVVAGRTCGIVVRTGRAADPTDRTAGRAAVDPAAGRPAGGGQRRAGLDRRAGRPHGEERGRGSAEARRYAERTCHRPEARTGHDRQAHPDLARGARQPEQAHWRVHAVRPVAASARPKPHWRWPNRCTAASRTSSRST